MNILVLTTRENFVWTSMQEIIPGIESLWSKMSNFQHHVDCLNVDDFDIQKELPKFLKADILVLTAFNLKIVRAFHLAKKITHFNGKTYIYLHQLATIACWPLNEWKMTEFLTANDVFISTCDRDEKLLKTTYSNATVLKVPFSLAEMNLDLKRVRYCDHAPFIYIGRISEQKNIHGLILFYSFYMKNSPHQKKLIIFGKEDDLGSPNMGRKSGKYLEILKELVSKLGMNSLIDFRGFVDREKIYKELDQIDYIFISLSLHSDENFGMAALRSLSSGRRCLLSDWGGHSDFIKYFPKQVHLVEVDKSAHGPVIHLEKCLKEMKKSSLINREEEFCETDYYNERRILNIIEKDLHKNHESNDLELTSLAGDIWKNKKESQIFKDYTDLRSIPFFECYGMEGRFDFELYEKANYYLVPWGQIGENRITINDPHKGEHNFLFLEGNSQIHDFENNRFGIDEGALSTLVENGHAFRWGFERIDVKDVSTDQSARSIGILKEKIINYFTTEGIENIHFADDYLELEKNNDDIQNIVLFGGYIERLLESGNWTFEKIRLWVLCESVKKVLIELFKIPSISIGIIPRDKIYPTGESAIESIDFNKKTFCYAGRISPCKNIEQIIWATYFLQTEYHKSIGLFLIGDFDNRDHDYQVVKNENHDYEKKIKDLIDSLNWEITPVLHKRIDADKWPSLISKKNAYYISTSTFLSEDFGVSVSQALDENIPCFISNWGGHRDINSLNVFKIPSAIVLPNQENKCLERVIGRNLARWMISFSENFVPNRIILKNKLIEYPKTISLDELDSCRRNFFKKWGHDALNLISKRNSFRETTKGKLFYNQLIESFADFSEENYIIILLKDGATSYNDLDEYIYDIFKKQEIKKEVRILYTSDIVEKRNILTLIKAEKIIVTFPLFQNEKFCYYLESLVDKRLVEYVN